MPTNFFFTKLQYLAFGEKEKPSVYSFIFILRTVFFCFFYFVWICSQSQKYWWKEMKLVLSQLEIQLYPEEGANNSRTQNFWKTQKTELFENLSCLWKQSNMPLFRNTCIFEGHMHVDTDHSYINIFIFIMQMDPCFQNFLFYHVYMSMVHFSKVTV